MDFEIEPSRFIQILHDDDRHHWVTVTNIGSDNPEEVYVFDSVFSCSSTCIRTQVGSLLHTDKSQFTLKFVDVHKQDGWNDCGLFSIAYTVALSFDLQPGTCVFEQNLMRLHLIRCLESHKFTTFPVGSQRHHGLKIVRSEDIKVFCLCRMPIVPTQPKMICCSVCESWFHTEICLTDVPKSAALNCKEHWSCPNCIDK